MPNSLFGDFGFSWLPRLTIGSFRDDLLSGSDHRDIILGLLGDDTVTGGGGDDVIIGGFGDDTADGGAGEDLLIGGHGNDTASYASAQGPVYADLDTGIATTDLGGGASETDQLIGFENLTGSDFNDTLGGTAGDNLLDGGDGDDRIEGAGGNDTIGGGEGTDTAKFSGSYADYTVDTSDPDHITVIGPDGTDVLTEVELLEFDDQTVDLRPMSPVINEFSLSTTGTDVEYVEFLADPNTDLSNLTLISIEGDSTGAGTIDSVHALGTTDANGFYLLEVAANTFENGSITLMLVENFTGAQGDDLDTDNDGVLDLTPWDGVIDDVAVLDGGSSDRTYSSTVLDEFFDDATYNGGSEGFQPGGASRIPDGTDTDTAADWVRNDFDLAGISGNTGTPELGEALNTPGAANAVVTDPGGGDPEELTIMQIQGAGLVSAYDGVLVKTSGVVTAVDSNGFYLQDPDGDGDIATSDGIFVFTGSAPTVAVGDALEVTGTVDEFTPGGVATRNQPTTEITSVESITVTGTGAVASTIIGAGGRLPPTESIDDDPSTYDPTADGLDFFESLEGMLVTAQDVMAISGTNSFGEIFGVVDQGAGATGITDRNTLNISEGDFNPERIQINADSGILPGFAFPDVSTGDLLGDVTGVMSYDFGNYEIHPTQAFTPTSAGLTQETTALAGTADQLSIATYNVLNLDPNDSDGDTDVADGRFEAIAAQIVNNMGSPDIIGLQEIQDNSGSTDDGTVSASQTLQMLVDAINALVGHTAYAWIDNTFIADGASGGQPGGNIRTAMLYNTDRVTLDGASVQTIGGQAAGEAFEGARLPLVADFSFNGETVTVVNNHLSSKGGSAPIMGTEQPFEELQENETVNGSLDERILQATAVAGFVSDLLDADPNANVVVLGDMNEFEFISPVEDILGAELTNLASLENPDEVYSYIFQGNSQALDHILVSDALLPSAQVDYVHTNSEFVETDDRGSDHDPIVALLDFGAPVV